MSGVAIALIIFASGFAILFAALGFVLIASVITVLKEQDAKEDSAERCRELEEER